MTLYDLFHRIIMSYINRRPAQSALLIAGHRPPLDELVVNLRTLQPLDQLLLLLLDALLPPHLPALDALQ